MISPKGESMERQQIQGLKDKDAVDSIFLVKEKNISIGKNGRLFMALKIGDKTGNMDCRVWENVDELGKSFAVGDLVKVKGMVQLFQNRRQLVIHRLERVPVETSDMSEFVSASKVAVDDLWTNLIQVMQDIKNQHIRQLVFSVLEDEEISPLLKKAPAAKTIHHAWPGGLLEHIVSIVGIMNFFSKHYPFLNRDLLLFGALFHDIGKIWELSYDGPTVYTNRGRLIGHLHMACELLDRKTQKIFGFPAELADICKHMILSHHGKLEYGSPRTPMFMEALMLSLVDELDSRLINVKSIIDEEKNEGQTWSRYVESFDRYFFLEDLKAKYENN